ncbi:hypothetical protein, partial [Hydrogenivirga sp. 128-5-R1-1]|uniref:hypothetical protein n=1 Tax=Hydrogenivirga sp. 128-5-R1-1 TaxID=392423 RepID=UPI00015EFC18
AYFTYIKLLKGFKSESEKISSQIESLVGLEVLRLDLEHLGYGISNDETNLILSWDSTNKELILRSTLNNTNSSTRGYILTKCNAGTLDVNYDGREDKTNPYVSVLDTENWNFFDTGQVVNNTISLNSQTCSNTKVYVAFPIRDVVYNGTSNGCLVSYCEQITYTLSNANLISRCNPGTYNLVRRIGTANTGGEPILNCVSDWKITVDIDLDGNGVIDSTETDLTFNNLDVDLNGTIENSEIRNNLKAVNVYILIQDGKYDPEYTYTQVSNCGADKCVSINGELLKLPANYIHYRWKPLKIKIKPMDL